MTISITTFRITKLSIEGLIMTLSIHDTDYRNIATLCKYAECLILFIVMLNVIMLRVVMVNVLMLSVAVLSFV